MLYNPVAPPAARSAFASEADMAPILACRMSASVHLKGGNGLQRGPNRNEDADLILVAVSRGSWRGFVLSAGAISCPLKLQLASVGTVAAAMSLVYELHSHQPAVNRLPSWAKTVAPRSVF